MRQEIVSLRQKKLNDRYPADVQWANFLACFAFEFKLNPPQLEYHLTRKHLLSISIGLLLSGGATIGALYAPAAFAQADNVATSSPADHAKSWGGHHGHMDMNATPAERAVLKDLRRVEMLYRANNRSEDLPAVYDSVLAKTQNATIRSYIEKRQVRAQRTPADADKAIASATQQLSSDLSALQ